MKYRGERVTRIFSKPENFKSYVRCTTEYFRQGDDGYVRDCQIVLVALGGFNWRM
jgi:hypothetical protein